MPYLGRSPAQYTDWTPLTIASGCSPKTSTRAIPGSSRTCGCEQVRERGFERPGNGIRSPARAGGAASRVVRVPAIPPFRRAPRAMRTPARASTAGDAAHASARAGNSAGARARAPRHSRRPTTLRPRSQGRRCAPDRRCGSTTSTAFRRRAPQRRRVWPPTQSACLMPPSATENETDAQVHGAHPLRSRLRSKRFRAPGRAATGRHPVPVNPRRAIPRCRSRNSQWRWR